MGEIGARQAEDPELPWLRINWEIKALVPIACVLLGGMLLFLLATLSWRDPERHIVLLVAGAGVVAIAALCSWFSRTPCNGQWSKCNRRSLNSAAAISTSL
jgi:hypothetical protein